MSGAPKRGAHEEGVHSSSSSMRPNFGGEEEEQPPVFGRLSYGPSQDSRPGLLPRPDSRDGERRSPLHSLYRMPPSMTDPTHAGHPVVGPEMRVESRDTKDNRESKGVDNSRDLKVESREAHHHSTKVEKEGRIESRGDDSKEAKQEREVRNDPKSDVKGEKDVHGVAGSHLNWKEQYRVKRHPDVPVGGPGIMGAWSSLPVRKYEVPKEVGGVSIMRENRTEANEAVGENKVDQKGDEKYKDKDRKRKEGKHHDWPESDKDRSDNRNSLLVGGSSNDHKEVTRDDRESERWEKERKDIQKEKERLKEKENHVDRDGQSGGAKDGNHNEKEAADKISVQEIVVEQKKPKEHESWRNMEREAKERRKERDGDAEGERPEKRSKCYDKESDEVGAEVDGGTDRERDAFSYGIQQRKRMLRPRGSPQIANRDARFKSRGQDMEG